MTGPRILRVFPRRTAATPTDALAWIGDPGLFTPEFDEVHVSCSFTWDLPEAERLVGAWSRYAPTRIGGPATGMRGEEFIPGRYVAPGYVITSRGCPNKCWFCKVWQREGDVRELPIHDGHNLLDDNILACSEAHIRAVFAMLKRQTEMVQFTGGLEAKLLAPWSAELLCDLRPDHVFFAYDTPDDLEPLRDAVAMLKRCDGGRKQRWIRAYVLCGYPRDTKEAAQERMLTCCRMGVLPMAMLYRGPDGKRNPEWVSFARSWASPQIAGKQMSDALREAI